MAAGAALSAASLARPTWLLAQPGQPKRGGLLRVRGYDPPHFDPHLTLNFKTNTTLSFTHVRLVRHAVGGSVAPGTFTIEPDLAERWEQPDDLTYVFHLRRGVRWHNKPPVNGREVIAEDVKFTYDRFLSEKGNPNKFMLDPVDRVEVVDRYAVRFRLKEPFVWLVHMLANPVGTWIIPREVVEKFGDAKKPEAAIGAGPFVLDRYEPNVRAVFKRNPTYFRSGVPYLDEVHWMILEDPSAGLSAYLADQLDCGPWHWWAVRQQDLDVVRKKRPQFVYRDFLSTVTTGIFMRTDKPPFNDVRVRRAVSHAIDRQAIIDAVFVKGEPTPAISRGLPEWSPRMDQLGPGAAYYRHDAREARRLLAEAGYPQGIKTRLNVTGGYGSDITDSFELALRHLKESGIDATLNIQEYGAYIATTFLGKYEGMGLGPFAIAWEPHSSLYGMYTPDQARNSSHVNDPKMTGLLKEQMSIKDVETRRRVVFDIQRYAAEQQYYVYFYAVGNTGTWQPYVKNYAPNPGFDYGGRASVLWLDRA